MGKAAAWIVGVAAVVLAFFLLLRARLAPSPDPAAAAPSVSSSGSPSGAVAVSAAPRTRVAPIAPPTKTVPAREPALIARVEPCDMAFDVQAADFDRDGVDEILVKCIESAHLLVLADDKTIVETYRFEPEPPPDWKRVVGEPSAADVDGDGNLDLLLCTTWTTQAGGTRGGQTWFAQGRSDGTFEPLAALVRGPCNAVALHDVTGDASPELVVVETGNPWQKESPNGAVAWLAPSSSSRRSWNHRGRVAASVYPDGLSFADANGDGIDDVIVSHGWNSGDASLLLLGGRRGLVRADADAGVPEKRDRSRTKAKLDKDDVADAVWIDQGRVAISRSEPFASDVVTEVRRKP